MLLTGETGVRRVAIFSFLAIPDARIRSVRALSPRRGCDSPRRSARINNRKPKGSCRQQSRTGKVNFVTIKCRSSNDHFAGGSPKCALCAAYAAASSSIESRVAASGSSLTTPEKMARSPISVSITNAGRCVI